MIARIWEGKTKIEYSETYREIIIERDIPDYCFRHSKTDPLRHSKIDPLPLG